MKRAVCLAIVPIFLLTALSASAQSEAISTSVHATDYPAKPALTAAASAPITTRLSPVIFEVPASEEGFATVRIADELGEAVYRAMIPVAAGARSLDLSAVRVPAAGHYSVRVIYPGGTVVKELETAYTAAGKAGIGKMAAGW